MDKVEARTVLTAELAKYPQRSYEELSALIGAPSCFERRGPSGAEYQIEIEAMWDSTRPNGNIRVLGSVDDGRFLAALSPICDGFIVAPDGSFVGE